jgi:DNA-binding NarL/FixJ family response regulator
MRSTLGTLIIAAQGIVEYFYHTTTGYRSEAQSVGATGYVLKSAAREELNQAIHNAIRGPA